SAEATLNGEALTWVSRGGRGEYDHDTGEYICNTPLLSLPPGTRVPPDAVGKDLLVVSDQTESLLLQTTDWFAPVSATLRPGQQPVHRHDLITVDIAPAGAAFTPNLPSLDFVNTAANHSDNVGAWSLVGSSVGWAATFDVPTIGTVELVAHWSRPPEILGCVGVQSCVVATE